MVAPKGLHRKYSEIAGTISAGHGHLPTLICWLQTAVIRKVYFASTKKFE